jgi:hypothetical protein
MLQVSLSDMNLCFRARIRVREPWSKCTDDCFGVTSILISCVLFSAGHGYECHRTYGSHLINRAKFLYNALNYRQNIYYFECIGLHFTPTSLMQS